MTKPILRLLAGPTAMARIKQHGLNQADFSVMVGASGGPKWFCLFGLDQYLFADFFSQRTTALHLLGSSAGAWRFACFAQADPVAASKRFCHAYSHVRYPKGADTALISQISAAIIDDVFPTDTELQQVLDNRFIKLNLVVAKARRISSARHKLLQAGVLTLAAGANLLNRKHLQHFFQRVLFHAPGEISPFHHAGALPTAHVELTLANLRQAVLASGAIPMVLNPVENIAGAGAGLYYDGGVTDYHFDLPFTEQGLVLYPHFYPTLTPGWFDKALTWRKTNPAYLHNVVLLCPSEQWVRSLPFGKIPDRTDFKLPDAIRINYWQQVIRRSHDLAEALKQGNFQIEAL
ncbi:patatin-like phospholipase family protein [Rheinheimera maricola]|uniref:Patatin-like phospholipase family protein n=1 Tax=Rheinheimera maricola TaxID=2793282 RepID=A0ABS7X5Y7_9GAMM|nr:patatin-like phospholipase family protein [Rheinheimera maricola]MBZ9610960.1 patatin-like phospholipase family protein [Rheinheimera maricola]